MRSHTSPAAFSLHEAIAVFKTHYLAIILSCAIGLGLGFLVSHMLPARYISTATILLSDADKKQPQATGGSLLGMVAGLHSQQENRVTADIEKIKLTTTPVIKPFINSALLNIDIIPNTAPLIGKWLARFHHSTTLAAPLFGLSQYDWGGAKLSLASFQFPEQYNNRNFTLTILGTNQYELLLGDTVLLTGQVGKHVTAQQDHRISINVRELRGNTGMKFKLATNSIPDTIFSIASNLTLDDSPIPGASTSMSLDTPATGYLQVTFTHANANLAQTLLNGLLLNSQSSTLKSKKQDYNLKVHYIKNKLAETYQQITAIRKSLDTNLAGHGQTTVSKTQFGMQASPASLTSSLAQQLLETTKAIQTLNLKKDFELRYLTKRSPSIQAINHELTLLEKEYDKVRNNINNIDSNTPFLQLNSEATYATQLVFALTTSLENLVTQNVNFEPDFKIIDPASTSRKVDRTFMLSIAGAIIAGLLSVLTLFCYYIIRRPILNPKTTAAHFNTRLITAIPFIKEHALHKQINQHTCALDAIQEALIFIKSDHHVINLTAPSYEHGTCSNALNLATTLARTNKKILLIDANIRQAKLSESLQQHQQTGLAHYLNGDLSSPRITTSNHGFDFIAAGSANANPATLYATDRMAALLANLKPNYDHIIICSPPALVISDTLHIAPLANITILILGVAIATFDDTHAVFHRLQQYRITVDGILCNYTSKRAAQLSSEYRYFNGAQYLTKP